MLHCKVKFSFQLQLKSKFNFILFIWSQQIAFTKTLEQVDLAPIESAAMSNEQIIYLVTFYSSKQFK